MSKGRVSLSILAAFMVFLTLPVHSGEPRAPQNNERLLVVISDLHMGLGKIDGKWHPYEDFRWPKALKGFLEYINQLGNRKTDLIIAGDFLELWQRPAELECSDDDPDLGCTPEQMREVVERIIKAHSGPESAFQSLSWFARQGDNQLHILPGNHDSALMLDIVWEPVYQALGGANAAVFQAGPESNGRWVSPEGFIVIEHGQQMGADLNRYDAWPRVSDSASGRMIRVSGELNVQQLFNDEERAYPIIDNLSPEAKGAWYRARDRGVWRSIGDVAKLLTFLLFETSLQQKGDWLGGEDRDTAARPEWDWDYARNTLQHKLVVLNLPEDDPIRRDLLNTASEDEGIIKLRDRLNQEVASMAEADLRHLCNLLASRGSEQCVEPTAGYVAEALFSSRDDIEKEYVSELRKLALRRSEWNSRPGLCQFTQGNWHEEARWTATRFCSWDWVSNRLGNWWTSAWTSTSNRMSFT